MSDRLKAKNKKFSLDQNKPENSTKQDWFQRIQPLISRYGWDFIGVFFFVLAFLTLLGLLGWTSGSFISVWERFLNRWLGYGSYAVVLIFLAVGIWIFRQRVLGERKFSLSRILLLEIGFFSLLAFLSVIGGTELSRAEAGLDGGIVGWGLASLLLRFLPQPILIFLLILFILVFFSAGFGLFGILIKLIDRWSAELIQKNNISDNQAINLSQNNIDSVNNKIDTEPRVQKKRQDGRTQKVMTPAPVINRDQTLPPLELLAKEQVVIMDDVQVRQMGRLIEQTLDEFGIPAKVAGFRVGPTVTQFAVEPGFVEREASDGTISKHKVRVSQISSLAKDLALSLSAERLRVEAPVPGQSYVGIEVPNPESKMVRLRPILESETFQRLNSVLALALGQDVSGQAVVADLIKMPHLLIAGTTGSGKSVCVSAITTCLLMNNSPENLKIAMLDPKMVELVRFNGVPHLMGKVETSIDRMIAVLRWAIAEMDQRYRLLEEARVRDLDAYNLKMSRKNLTTLPRIVVIIDELADMMMSSPDQTEHSLVRLAQMARAVGIHLIVATQRPSTDVVTGLIKANFPARISFTVASSIDSRVILDVGGAETLMGKGDMLFLAPDVGSPQRAQGVMVTDQEINNIINYWQSVESDSGIEGYEEAPWEGLMKVMEEDGDELVNQAVELVQKSQRASASLLQRRLRIGFPRAARLLDQLEEMGIVGPSLGGGRDREVLIENDDEEEENENY
jgi:S-DNA-T family DNA segregation ATPase FtsK/SpoIIIE